MEKDAVDIAIGFYKPRSHSLEVPEIWYWDGHWWSYWIAQGDYEGKPIVRQRMSIDKIDSSKLVRMLPEDVRLDEWGMESDA